MSPSPLPSHLVALLLSYIIPSDDLAIPTHLISKPLLQRHHFLQLSPHDVKQYLSWPSNDQQRVVSQLESAHLSPDNASHLDVQYTSDIEFHYAHVHIPGPNGGVRLVFLWEEDGWKYHDLGLMPFPTSSRKSVNVDPTGSHSQHGVPLEDDDDDSYWDSYAAEDPISGSASATHVDEDNEDAYWAQYSNVHGSGDSTQPSPPQIQRKLPKEVEIEDPILFSYDSLHPPTLITQPSPLDLAARLTNISPRPSYHSSRAPSVLDIQEVVSPITEEDSEDSDKTPSPPNGHSETSSSTSPRTTAQPDRNTALKAGLHGLYSLWLVGQSDVEMTAANEVERKMAFLDLVKEAIELS